MLIKALAAAAGNFGVAGYDIDNSLRFNDNDSAYLSWTPSVAGDRSTFTFSAWVKRGNVGAGIVGNLFSVRDTSTTRTVLRFNGDSLDWLDDDINFRLITSAKLRDVGGWYHIVATADTTQATASERLKIYINGVRVSSFSTSSYPSQNYETEINSTRIHALGVEGSTTNDYLDGYLAEVNFIDGQALTADDFGEINEDTGEWSPKRYSGTYGTNGFYLAFEDGSALGDDTSGNTNDWTPTNLASTDQMLDTPTNNFAVLNPLNDNGSGTQSEGNLKYTQTSATTYTTATSTMQISGKRYWEVYVDGDTAYSLLGILGDGALPSAGGTSANQAGGKSYGYSFNYLRTSLLNNNAAVVTGLNAYNNTDIIGFCFDADTNKFWYAINGVWQQSGDPAAGTNPLITVNDDSYTPCISSLDSSCVFNFGADSSFAGLKTRQGNTDANGIGDFYYTPPTGYLALCTDNLPAPAIEQPETQFNVVTYTGDGTSSNAITGVGFQPDFVWLKERNNTAAHFVYDSVRGATLGIHTNLTDAEATYTDGLTSFDTDGFTVGSRSNNNGLGDTYVAWCWKAGGTAVTNTDGSITSQVSANVDAGFSIVGYAGNGSAGTVGHGLSSAPEMIIVKSRNDVTNWPVYHVSTGNTGQTYLSAIDAFATSSVRWNNTSPTSSVFSLGTATNVNGSGYNFIAYCFHSVEGFSKFGSYTGNGSADGPFIYTGFRPAFVMIKRTDSAGNAWYIWDNELNPYNADGDNNLWANNNNAENTNDYAFDGLSDGFKIRATTTNLNASSGNYIFMAFAEAPLKNSLGR